MKRGLFSILVLLLAAPAFADTPGTIVPEGGSSFDVAPTTLDLKAGEPGLFYITNHGNETVTIQIEALDWSQSGGDDTLHPSQSLFTSPPLARISPGARQSVRVLARPAGDRSETAYRLRVSELPDSASHASGVKVLLQFSVPVFVDHQGSDAPKLAWDAVQAPDGLHIAARNQGSDTIKLIGLTLNGAPLGGGGFTYILPGASHSFHTAAVSGPLHLAARDARSGHEVALDLAAHG